MRSTGIGTAGTLVARGLIEDGERVVLADFSGDSALAIAATAALRVQLGESGVVSVAEPSLVAGVLKRMGVEGGSVSFERASEVAEREGFKAVVDGSVVPAGGGYVLTARVIETATGTELVSVGATASDVSDFLSAVDRLSRKLRERLGDSLGSIRESVALERATTTSLEALRKYTRGVDAFNARDNDQAIALLEEAIALDSSFAMAWRKLAAADFNRRATAAIRAYELRDGLTERERYHAIGAYHVFATLDFDEAAVIYRRLVEAYPDDQVALVNLGWSYGQLGREELAAEMIGRAVASHPYDPGAYRFLIPILHETGQVDSARAVLRAFAEDFPDHPDGPQLRALFAYMDGDIGAAEAEIESLLSSEAGSVQRNASRRLSELRVVSGRLEDARTLRRRYLVAANSLGEALWEVSIDLIVRKDTSAAIGGLRAALDAASDRAVERNAGRLSSLFYATGDVDLGDRYYERAVIQDSAEDAYLADPEKRIAVLNHRIRRGLAVGEYEEVIEASRQLEMVYPYRDRADLAHQAIRAFEALGQADSVIAHYEAWIGRRTLFRRVAADALRTAVAPRVRAPRPALRRQGRYRERRAVLRAVCRVVEGCGCGVTAAGDGCTGAA